MTTVAPPRVPPVAPDKTAVTEIEPAVRVFPLASVIFTEGCVEKETVALDVADGEVVITSADAAPAETTTKCPIAVSPSLSNLST